VKQLQGGVLYRSILVQRAEQSLICRDGDLQDCLVVARKKIGHSYLTSMLPIIADYLIAAGETVFHILGKDRIESARMIHTAKPGPDASLTYAAAGRPLNSVWF
jgi:hypothetical protein